MHGYEIMSYIGYAIAINQPTTDNDCPSLFENKRFNAKKGNNKIVANVYAKM